MNCALLPPCRKVLDNKLLRARYVSHVWSRATTKNPSEDLCPSKFGWSKVDNKWKIAWFSGSSIPDTLSDDKISNDNIEEDDENSEDDIWSEDEEVDEEM